MAPKAKDTDNMKQKSLTSFFGKKEDATSAAPTEKPKPKPSVAATPQRPKGKAQEKADAQSSPLVKVLQTPLPKTGSQSSGVTSATYTRSSDGGRSAFETPPSSDPIDVDMDSSDIVASDVAQGSAGNSVRVVLVCARS